MNVPSQNNKIVDRGHGFFARAVIQPGEFICEQQGVLTEEQLQARCLVFVGPFTRSRRCNVVSTTHVQGRHYVVVYIAVNEILPGQEITDDFHVSYNNVEEEQPGSGDHAVDSEEDELPDLP